MKYKKLSLSQIVEPGPGKREFFVLCVRESEGYRWYSVQATRTTRELTFFAEEQVSSADGESVRDYFDADGLPCEECELHGVKFAYYDSALTGNHCWAMAMGNAHNNSIKGVFKSLHHTNPGLYKEFKKFESKKGVLIEERVRQAKLARKFGKKIRLTGVEDEADADSREESQVPSEKRLKLFRVWFVDRIVKRGFEKRVSENFDREEQAVKQAVARYAAVLEKTGFRRSNKKLFKPADPYE